MTNNQNIDKYGTGGSMLFEIIELMANNMNETNRVNNSSCLHEIDIPGASLGNRDPSSLKIPELKHWLICRNASTKGKKVDFVLR